MVCVPCIVIPFFLFIWYRFIQPIVLKFWNPWQTIEVKKGNTEEQSKDNDTCPIAGGKSREEENISCSNSLKEDTKSE
ncbi:hypothetical protein L9F63_008305, partial [Diploptera punctata]